MKELNVDYIKAEENSVRADVEKAVSRFIQGDIGYSMSMFPQALNPFLRAIESMGVWRRAMIIPYHDKKNKPIYVIVKIGDSTVTGISVKGE